MEWLQTPQNDSKNTRNICIIRGCSTKGPCEEYICILLFD